MAVMHNLLIGANAIIITGKPHIAFVLNKVYLPTLFLSILRRKSVGWGVRLCERL